MASQLRATSELDALILSCAESLILKQISIYDLTTLIQARLERLDKLAREQSAQARCATEAKKIWTTGSGH
jgi:hypothetical protein